MDLRRFNKQPRGVIGGALAYVVPEEVEELVELERLNGALRALLAADGARMAPSAQGLEPKRARKWRGST